MNKNDRFTHEEIDRILKYDPETGLLRWRYRDWDCGKFNTKYAGKVAGTVKKGYVQIVTNHRGLPEFLLGHRVAWMLTYGKWPDGVIDHIDHDTLNNRISNLRDVSSSENAAHKKELRGRIGYKGVYLHRSGKFGAQIKHKYRHEWLGLFDTSRDAALAYDEAAKRLHGEHAFTNVGLGLL
jgi:hypothetical protein